MRTGKIDPLNIWFLVILAGVLTLVLVILATGCAVNFGSGQTEATYTKEDVITGTNDVMQFRLR